MILLLDTSSARPPGYWLVLVEVLVTLYLYYWLTAVLLSRASLLVAYSYSNSANCCIYLIRLKVGLETKLLLR